MTPKALGHDSRPFEEQRCLLSPLLLVQGIRQFFHSIEIMAQLPNESFFAWSVR